MPGRERQSGPLRVFRTSRCLHRRRAGIRKPLVRLQIADAVVALAYESSDLTIDVRRSVRRTSERPSERIAHLGVQADRQIGAAQDSSCSVEKVRLPACDSAQQRLKLEPADALRPDLLVRESRMLIRCGQRCLPPSTTAVLGTNAPSSVTTRSQPRPFGRPSADRGSARRRGRRRCVVRRRRSVVTTGGFFD